MAEIETTIRTWLRQGIVMAEFSGMVARPVESPGETIALLTEMDRKMKLVEDVTGGSQRDARAVSTGGDPGSSDPPTPPVTIRSHMRPSRRSCRSSPTTRRRARKQCRLDELKQAPLRRRQPGRRQWQRRPRTAGRNMVLSTPWVRNSAGLAKDTVTYPGTVPTARAGKGKGKGKGKGAYEWARATLTGTRAATTGCTREVERRTVRALMVPSRGTRRVTASLEGKDPGTASATLAVEIILHEIAPKGGGKGGIRALEAWETWEEPPLVEHARVLSSLREARAGPQRVSRELRKKFMTCADINCNCKDGHQQAGGEVSAPPGLQANGQDGEWEVKVSKKNQKSQKQRKREQAGRTLQQEFTYYTSAAILIENVQDDRARPREGSQRRRRLGGD